MKLLFTVLMSFALLSAAQALTNQSIRGATNSYSQDDKTIQKKGQNNNTVRSNRTDNKAVIEQNDQNSNSSSDLSKKGYDYYKAKTDMNSTGAKGKAQDHNSSRSNKSSSSVAPNPLNSANDSTSVNVKSNHNTTRSNRTTTQEPSTK